MSIFTINEKQSLTPSTRSLSDSIAASGGSRTFILAILLGILFWIGLIVTVLLNHFDPYPFILLNHILSCMAALQAPIIMTRQTDREIKALHGKFDQLMAQHKEMFAILKQKQP